MLARTVKELLDWQPPPVVETIGGGVLHPKGRMVLFGRTGSWKSMLGIHTGFCLADGKCWLDFATTPSRVLMAQVEIPEVQLRKRVEKYVSNNGKYVPTEFLLLSEPFLRLDNVNHFRQFDTLIKQVKPDVLILDPLYRLCTCDISDNHQLEAFMDIVDDLANRHNLSVILISHTVKLDRLEPGESRDWIQSAIGGSFLMNWADTMVAIEPVTDTAINLHFLKVRAAEDEIGVVQAEVDRGTLHFRRVYC